MEGEWPLVGRAAELERVGRLLRGGGGGVVLAGPAGVGKTRLAAECLVLAERSGFVPLRVGATQAAATLPFGAYAAFIPELAGGTDRADVLRQVTSAVVGRGEGKPVAVLVDDAHLLDDASAALTHQLAASTEAFVVATVRSGEPASDAVVAVWKDGLAERFEVTPFSGSEVEGLLTTVLAGPIDGATVRVLFERTDGNVLFLKELVLGALEARVLSDEGGVWRLQGHLPPSARLVELVEGRLAGLAEAERETLEVLALGEPLGVELLQGLKRDASLPGLERQGLARVDEDGRRLGVRLAHPLYGEVVRSRLSPLRVRTLSRMLAQATTTAGGRRRDDVLRIAAWQLQGGGSLDLDIMLAGARQAHARHDLDLAERLARAAREEGGGFEAGLLLGVVVSQAGRFKEADADLGTLAPEAATDDQRVALALTRIQYLIASGAGSGEAIRVAAEAEATILDPGARAQVAASRTYLLSMGGRQPEARELAESVLSWATGRGLVIASMVACPLFGRAGRLADALAANDRGLATHLALADRSFWYCPQLHVLTRSMALTLAGCSVAAEAAAHGEYLKAVADGSVDGQAYSSWALSLALLAQGRVESAARWGRLAVELTRRTGQTRTVANTLLSLAMALALAGRAEEASNVVAEREALPKSGEEYPVQALLTRAWIFVARGDRLMATEVLTEASLVARNEGSFAEESAALHDLARLGHAAGVAPRLAELAEIVEGPLTPARAAHAAALVEKDPAALDAASVVFEEMNALLLAAEAAADAAVAWRKAGDPRRAAAAERRAHALAGKCEGARTPALTAVGARAALTARELEIARLAAAGVANKEIAARLYLSLHTVQNKLHAAYEKLGVEGRAELAQALEDY